MSRYARFPSFRHRAAWLFAIGLFAMAMHAFGGSGIMRPNSVASGFYAEICTSQGLSKLDPSGQSGIPPLPDGGHHDCCKLCVASAPLLPVDAVLGVPPAPTVAKVFFAACRLRPAAIARLSKPPRGPPLV